jgi:hypothetical protein
MGQGAAYVFVEPTSAGWSGPGALGASAVLTAPDPGVDEGLGGSVAVSDGKVVVGDDGRTVDGKPVQGAVFVWDSHGGGWDATPTPYEITADDGQTSDTFGNTVAAQGSFLAISAIGRGVVYLLTPPRPRLTALTQTPATWRAGNRAPMANPTHLPSGGTTYSFNLSKPASVRFEIEKRLPGRRRHGHCDAVTASNRHRPHCVRFGTGHAFRFTVPGGHNTVWFDGRISTRRLTAGSYRIVLTARAGGATSAPKRLRFTIR